TGATSVGFDGEAAVIVNGPAVRFDEASFEPTIVDTEGELINLAEVHESDSGGVLVSDGEGRVSSVDFDAQVAEVLLPPGSLGIPLSSVAVDNQFDSAVFAAEDGRFEVWSLVGDRVLAQAVPREGTKTGIDPSGRYLAEGNTVPGTGSRVWDLEAREVIFESDLDWVNYRDDRLALADQDVQPLPDGRPVALWNADGGVTHEFLAPYQGMTDGWSPELGLTAMPQTLFGIINVIDPETGEIVVELDDLIGETEYDINDVQRWPVDLEFDPAGEVLLGATIGGRVVLWDTESWETIVELEPEVGFVDGDYSADGTELVTLHADGFISRRDPRTLELLETSSQNPSIGRGNGLGVAISDAGDTIVNFGQTSATIWDAESLTPIGDPFPHGVEQGWGGQFAVQAERLVTMTGPEILVWNVDTASWPDLACAAAGRNLTQRQWDEFGPEGERYQITCPQYPPGE
ncbi:MAG: WD40 repeat domain-containing protein, partial [Acidimicrobiales bacterium]